MGYVRLLSCAEGRAVSCVERATNSRCDRQPTAVRGQVIVVIEPSRQLVDAGLRAGLHAVANASSFDASHEGLRHCGCTQRF